MIINYLLWSRGAMEMPQHGNVSTCLKKKQKPLKNRFFETFPQFLQEKRISLKTQFLRGFLFSPDNYFWRISQYFWGISQYFWGISAKFLRRFRILITWFSWGVSSFFLRRFLFFLRRFRFLKKVLKLYFVEAFPFFWGVSVFWKNF